MVRSVSFASLDTAASSHRTLFTMLVVFSFLGQIAATYRTVAFFLEATSVFFCICALFAIT